MPGLVRAMAATAVVAGTATATRNAVSRRQADKNVAAYAEAENHANEQYAQPAPAPLAAPAPAPQDDLITQLEQLAALKDQGILTEEEFAQQKAKLLGI